jgi:hypothetical protein
MVAVLLAQVERIGNTPAVAVHRIHARQFHGLLDWQVAGLFAFDSRSGIAGRNAPPAETNSDAERPTAWLGW